MRSIRIFNRYRQLQAFKTGRLFVICPKIDIHIFVSAKMTTNGLIAICVYKTSRIIISPIINGQKTHSITVVRVSPQIPIHYQYFTTRSRQQK